MPAAETARPRHPETRPEIQHDSVAETLVLGRAITTATAKKPVNVEAISGYSRGESEYNECANYAEGKGPFEECVTVSGMFGGSCTNCHYNSKGKQCSFRPADKPRIQPITIASTCTFVKDADSANTRDRVAKRKCRTTKYKWMKLLRAIEGVADAIEDIIEDMD